MYIKKINYWVKVIPKIVTSVLNKRITFITKRKIPITTKQNKITAKKNTNLNVFSIKLINKQKTINHP